MAKSIIFEDESFQVFSTGHDYDFIGGVINKTDKDISINLEDDFEPINLKANDWIGILADEEGKMEMRLLTSGRYDLVYIYA